MAHFLVIITFDDLNINVHIPFSFNIKIITKRKFSNEKRAFDLIPLKNCIPASHVSRKVLSFRSTEVVIISAQIHVIFRTIRIMGSEMRMLEMMERNGIL